jgi:hypothetical protein
MVIDNYLIHYKKPAQYLYWGETGVEIYRQGDSEKSFKKLRVFPNLLLSDITPQQFREIAMELLALNTGILLNSGQFIFNIFEFEKIPFQEKMRRQVVEWRLKKVFPENIDDYVHSFYKLSATRILSVLFKKSLKEKIETFFKENNLNLIYIGNSTMEIIDRVGASRVKKTAPDFFIEVDKALSIVVFLDKGVPFYIRKFRGENAAGIASEVIKTVNFIKNSYSKEPRSYFLAADPSEVDFSFIKDELSGIGIQPVELKQENRLFFPR